MVKKICTVSWNIFSIVIFPIGIIRIVRKIAPLLILPAADKFNLEKKINELNSLDATNIQRKIELKSEIAEINQNHENREAFLNNHEAEQLTVKTDDGIEIDTLKIKNKNSDKWIVYFCPNSACYEQLLDVLKIISEKTGANVYTGNYRGVMLSKGSLKSTQGMILDGKAMIQRLIKEGIPQKNILIHGWSIGGAVATEVASLFPKVHHCNDRSFASLTHEIKGWVPIIGGVLGCLASAAGWKFNCVKSFQKIEGKKLIIYSKKDGIIPFKSSLYNVIKNKNYKINTIEFELNRNDFNHIEFVKDWKERHPKVEAKKAERLANKKFDWWMQVLNHNYPLTELEGHFEKYIQFVQEALELN